MNAEEGYINTLLANAMPHAGDSDCLAALPLGPRLIGLVSDTRRLYDVTAFDNGAHRMTTSLAANRGCGRCCAKLALEGRSSAAPQGYGRDRRRGSGLIVALCVR